MPGQPLAPDRLAAIIESKLVGRPIPQGRRLLGVEYERLILHRKTRASAPLAFCRDLLERLTDVFQGERILEGEIQKGVRADGFELSMEPGGQLELAADPKENLDATDAVVEHVTQRIDRALAETDYVLASLGHAPVTPIEEFELLPRERYKIMNVAMPARGALSRNMMRATAGFQLTYDLTDPADAGRKLAMLFRLAPVFLALTANSREVAGKDSGYASYRHKVWLETDAHRSGIPEGCLLAETAIAGYVEYAIRAHMLFLVRDGKVVAAPDRSLGELVAEGVIYDADVDDHLSTLFPFVRLRNYLEIRCFDSVPWEHARSVLAMVSGVMYCDKATAAAEALSMTLLPEDADQLHALHLDAARSALEARTPDRSRSLRELADDLIGFSAATLGGETCNWARPADLDFVRLLVRA